ncbi:unnamed protein product [Lathyrus sativus]|nr:unnamed protein product [Lathyrus sativus]
MGERRGNSASIIIIFQLCMFVFYSKMIYAETYIVGDKHGWTFNVENWPAETTFNAGDILVFNYDPSKHDVVKVTEDDYNTCADRDIEYYRSGADRITLVKGGNYFICGEPGHCDAGQKIAIIAN